MVSFLALGGMMKYEAAFIQSVLNSSEIRSIMDHQGWGSIIAIITRLMHGSQNKADQTIRDPGLDSLIKGTHYNGQVSFAKTLLHTFSSLYDRAGTVLKDAQTKLPRAPAKGKRDTSDPVLSEPDTRKEEPDERREKQTSGVQ